MSLPDNYLINYTHDGIARKNHATSLHRIIADRRLLSQT